MHRKLLSCALLLEVHDELLPSIFTTSIRVQSLDRCLTLSLDFGFVVGIGFQGFTFTTKEVYVRESRTIVRKCDKITASSECGDWGRTP